MKEFFEMPKNKGTCKDCIYRQPTQSSSKVIQYCSSTYSNRTNNGLKKIKIYMSCSKFKRDDRSVGYEG